MHVLNKTVKHSNSTYKNNNIFLYPPAKNKLALDNITTFTHKTNFHYLYAVTMVKLIANISCKLEKSLKLCTFFMFITVFT